MLPRFRPILTLAALLFCATAARAQIVFTFTGTVDSDCLMLGYTTPGQTVTFTVVTNSRFASNSSSDFGPGAQEGGGNKWAEELTGDDRLFTSLTGTGLTNSLVRPTANPDDPFSDLITSAGNSLQIYISTDSSTNQDIGPTINGGPQLYTFNATVTFGAGHAGILPTLSSYTDPVDYFSSPGILGTYGNSDFSSIDVTLTSMPNSDFPSGQMVEFNITGLTISAIPEPATYAAMLGLAALGAIAMREVKRRKQA